MRILVTGGSGFVGRRLLPLLAGHDIVCLTRRNQGLDAPDFATVVEGDLGHPGAWEADIERFAPQWCLHLAWEGLPDYSLARCRSNLETGLRLLETLVRAQVRRLVVAGTCWEYGATRGAAHEAQPAAECGVFAATKTALRTVLESVAREARLDYRWARPFFVYGPGQRAQSLIPHCQAAFAAHRQPEIRQPRIAQDFIHVDDVAAGLVALIESDAASGIYNLGTGTPTAVGDVANEVARFFDAPPPCPAAGHDDGFWADTAKTKAATGWRAQISLRDGLARTLRAVEAQP